MANLMNDYFVNVAKKLSDGSSFSEGFDSSKLEKHINQRFNNFVSQYNLPLMSVKDTEDMINKLESSKATGHDSISVKVLKLVSPVFSKPLTKLFSLSITKGCFPKRWKLARVTPLHKDGARDNCDNYRPISILSVLSKLLEKHVAASLMAFMSKHHPAVRLSVRVSRRTFY
jgi:hypothetical protein